LYPDATLSLTPGSRLGPYEILAPLGAGGMGEVYRARDTRLEREVAVKVLPAHLSSSEEMRQRFEREARAISQLSHPHICALYDVGSHEGVEYLVMELLEGEMLADRLAKGPLPLEQTLRHGVEIADALDRAHRQGIVHRDLKPGNVMLTKSGVKLLDFGLAKVMTSGRPLDAAGREQAAAAQHSTAGISLTAVPTVMGSPNLTQEGTILGTFQYMAPEQLEGREADSRSDIFAFGAVLYEMATGRKAFEGKSQASLISAIMKEEPVPVSAVQPMSPPAFDHVVKTCLAKDPEGRWQSAHDIAGELQWIAQGGTQAAAAAAPSRKRERIAWGVTGAVVLAAGALVTLLSGRRSEPRQVLQASILPPEGWSFSFLTGPMALSPDGKQIAFVARKADGKRSLWVRALDGIAREIPGTDDASYPFWSPDSRFVALQADGMVKKVASAGGFPEKVTPNSIGRGGSWNRDGVILASRLLRGTILRFPAGGGDPAPATERDRKRGEFQHTFPFFLPDGKHFLFSVVGSSRLTQTVEIFLQALDAKEKVLLVTANSNAVYAPPGYLLFCQGSDLVAQSFDAASRRLTGDHRVVAQNVRREGIDNVGMFSVSETGLLVYEPGGVVGLSQLTLLDRGGKQIAAVSVPGNYWTPHLSHDGRRVAAEVIDPLSRSRDIWLFDVSGAAPPKRFTFDPAEEYTPVWSPDDRTIVFTSAQDAEYRVSRKAVEGSGTEEPLWISSGGGLTTATDWSSDGRRIALNHAEPGKPAGLWIVDVAAKTAKAFPGVPEAARDGEFSPDGRWIAYMSDESGRPEVYVRGLSAPGGPWQISTAGGRQPRWRSDGGELFYVAPDAKLMSVPVKPGSAFAPGAPQPLFETRLRQTVIAQYDVSPDGRSFLMNVVQDEPSVPITLIQNWTKALPP
jgi:Tol biopolymer transport system component